MSEQDKQLDVGIKVDGFESSLTFKNYNSRVVASLGDLLIDRINYCRWNNAVRFLDRYNKRKEERNLAGKETPLPPKFLFEILENGFIEEDYTLQDLWVKLLINWQNPEKRLDMRPVYISIIKSLTPTEAKILKCISQDLIRLKSEPNHSYAFSTDYYDFSQVGYFISKKRVINELQLSEDDYTLSMLNLFRCMCMESVKTPVTSIIVSSQSPVVKDHQLQFVKPTVLGINLINNCIID